jgi:murein DD-endopeptidase MepM/ murein hydrolase activator NlpD
LAKIAANFLAPKYQSSLGCMLRMSVFFIALCACVSTRGVENGAVQAKQTETPLRPLLDERIMARATVPKGGIMPMALVDSWRETLRIGETNLADEMKADLTYFGDVPLWLAQAMSKSLTAKSNGAFIVPLEKETRITSAFGDREHPLTGEFRFHRGVDLEANFEEPVLASASGKVTASEWQEGYGFVVTIDHQNGFTTRDAHLAKLTAHKGESVAQQQKIGLAGDTGNATGVHLHFEIQYEGRDIDPQSQLTLQPATTEASN